MCDCKPFFEKKFINSKTAVYFWIFMLDYHCFEIGTYSVNYVVSMLQHTRLVAPKQAKREGGRNDESV